MVIMSKKNKRIVTGSLLAGALAITSILGIIVTKNPYLFLHK